MAPDGLKIPHELDVHKSKSRIFENSDPRLTGMAIQLTTRQHGAEHWQPHPLQRRKPRHTATAEVSPWITDDSLGIDRALAAYPGAHGNER